MIFERRYNKNIPKCLLNLKFWRLCKNIDFIDEYNTEFQFDDNMNSKRLDECSNDLCQMFNGLHFKSLNTIFLKKSNFLVPGFVNILKFTPLYFKINSIEDELNIYKILCKTFPNENWIFNKNLNLDFYWEFKTIAMFTSDENIQVYQCKKTKNSNFYKDCKWKMEKFRYFDHKIIGLNCWVNFFNENLTNSKLKGWFFFFLRISFNFYSFFFIHEKKKRFKRFKIERN